MILNGRKARLYNYLNEILNQHMDNYNYEFVLGESDSNKYYTNDLENIEVHEKNSNDLVSDVEVISMGYNLLKRFGLEEVEIHINKNEEVNSLLEMLDIYYVYDSDENTLGWTYVNEDEVVGVGYKKDNEIGFKINIDLLLDILMKDIRGNALNINIDVCVIGISEEESYNALKIAQDLRMNNVNTVINEKVDSKFNILLDDENLNKGIVVIKDNYTNEEVKIDEADVIDYVLGNI